MPILIKMAGELMNEWAIVELQGDIKSHSESSLEGQFLGHLHYTKQGIPTLIIGHHLLYGKEVKLEKPFALLEKQRSEDNSEYIIKSIIRRKLLFKTRPKPIVGT
ncbi:chromosome transmission fidelity protein 8 homolog [Photinus pyralis]|uniref:Chromosome transmission fidelity protein 8 homolog n=1 Tax=Photinus pyralis TaxID=7054 RepID=A0A1Y1K437_PHOPY|nr:chromosome transmission fidelity protein 8 homolog [Photinus pyralis]